MKTNFSYGEIYKGFKKVDHTKIEDLEGYIYTILSSDKTALAGDKFQVSIGTDSLFSPKGSHWVATYMTTIAFTYGNMGTHLIFRKDNISGKWDNKLDLFTRLWREVEMSADLATWIKTTCNFSVDVHLDINPNPKYKSNILFNAAEGYIKSLGFNVELKPDSAIASCAADHFLGL